MKLRYVGVQAISREEAEAIFNGSDTGAVCQALVDIVHSDPDWKWLQGLCLKFIHSVDLSDPYLSDSENATAGLAITCLGHIARIHRTLDLDLVLPLLNRAKKNIKLVGRVETALDDIQMFLCRGAYQHCKCRQRSRQAILVSL